MIESGDAAYPIAELVRALLNSAAGVCLVIPAIRLTIDLLLIEQAENKNDTTSEGRPARHWKIVELSKLNLAHLRDKLSNFDLIDTLFLVVGLVLFLVAAIIDVWIRVAVVVNS